MKYLGFIITPNGLKTDPEKIQSINAFPQPTTRTELKGFLGLAGHYRRFVEGFSKIADPLHKLLRKDSPYEWTPKREREFRELQGTAATIDPKF